jgi:tetratricopeptide (TPR) repeat protein
VAKPKQRRKQELVKRHKKRLAARRGNVPDDPRIVEKALQLIERRQWHEARELLEEADESRPGQQQVMLLLMEVCHDTGDFPTYCSIGERLVRQAPENPNYQVALAGGYLAAGRGASALLAFRRYVQRWPDDPLSCGARDEIAQLEAVVEEMLAGVPFPVAEKVDLAALHEGMLADLSLGEFGRVIELGQKLLARCPDFVPAMNNLSQAYWQTGRTAEAIAMSQRVLARDPENYHALANLARLLFLAGQTEEAQGMCRRLPGSHPDGLSLACKKAEIFSYLGDDGGVLAAFEEAERTEVVEQKSPDVALLFHLAAVAKARQGDWHTAQDYWRRALKVEPEFELAKQNLADSRQSVGQRHGPWPYGFEYWIRRDVLERLAAAVEPAGEDPEAQNQAVRSFALQHRELTSSIPHLLDRGDEAGRSFAWRVARLLDTPEIRDALLGFCLSQRGPDQLRIEIANYLSQCGMLPDGRARLWLEGEWREIECMGFEIVEEPTGQPHTPCVDRWARDALAALHKDDGTEAERLLQMCLEVEPDRPELLNNLAQAFVLQGKKTEAESLIRQIHERWPDYFFGRISMANLAMQAGDLEKAETYLAPLRRQMRLHLTEFDALAGTYFELCFARGEMDAARRWLEMWKQINPDHPGLPQLERRLSLGGLLDTMTRLVPFGGRRRRRVK